MKITNHQWTGGSFGRLFVGDVFRHDGKTYLKTPDWCGHCAANAVDLATGVPIFCYGDADVTKVDAELVLR